MMNHNIITLFGALLGALIGATTMWWSLKDRMTKEVEDRVEYRINTETKITRCQEKIKSLEADVWNLRTQKE